MSYFSKRLLKYETNTKDNYLDYGEVVQVITDKLVNINMGGSDYTLESVGIEGDYIPKIGDWVTVEWKNGNPVARGASGVGGGLRDPNTPKIISTDDLAQGTINSEHIRTNTIEARHIQAYAVEAEHISANSITSDKISANAIQTQHISANSIDAIQIKAGVITSQQIKAGSIDATSISANAISSVNIQANSIQTQHISANAVQANQISANSIDASKIQANAINATHISANSITATAITANAIRTQHVSANTIQGQHISANSISGNHIVAGTIQTGHISANSINAGLIQANAINVTHITANAITATAISSNSIQTRHISANSIVASLISANQINATHISANSIQSNMISANQIQAQHISANQVNATHISANSITGDKIQANQISGNHIVAGTLDADKLTVGTLNQGLLGQYYTHTGGTNKFQTYKGHQIDTVLNFSWGTGSPSIVGQSDNFAVRWQGFIFAPETGAYSFVTTADDGTKLVVNNATVINNWIPNGGAPITGNVSLTAGNYYPILLEYFEGTGTATMKLEWTKPSLVREVIPTKYLTQGNTVIDGATITTGSITASSMQVGTITASSGILATAVIQTANIADGIITSVKIGSGEIKTANIASGNITNAHIANATIGYSKINSVDATTITVGKLNGQIISGGTITGDLISGGTITGDKIKANTIDSLQIKSGAITTTELSAGSITSDKIQAGAITSDAIRVGSITAEHISTIGLDAQIMQVYNSQTGETLIGGGYLRVDGLDAGVIQSDNLLQNGLFLTSSSDYGFKRDNPSGEALLGNTNTGIGAHQVWKINLSTGAKVKAIDIPSKKPFDISVHPSGNFAYITVQGDDTLAQLDLVNDVLTTNTLKLGTGPARIKWRDMMMMDMKHFFVLNADPMDMNIPDSLMVIDTPPTSLNGDLYVHHEIALGNNPYDFMMDDNHMTYITMASEGDIVVLDTSSATSSQWKIVGRIPISAFGTDNYHGGLPATFGLNEVTGGDASGQYSNSAMGDMAGMSMGGHSHGGYGASDGSLRSYEPHGIVQSSDTDTIYVVDYKNGELVVIDKNGNAPYNALVGTTAQGSFNGATDTSMGGMSSGGTMVGTSPAMLKANGELAGGGPGTNYVRYRITLGDSPDFIELVNGKLFITLEGSNDIAVIDEMDILNEITADRSFYGTKKSDGTFTKWDFSQSMRTVNPIMTRTIMNIGSKPSFIHPLGNSLYVTLSGQNQVAEINATTETVVRTINVGTNPQGIAFTPDNLYMYVANYGGTGDLSFVYPMGSYIGDPYMGLEGGIDYQGADGWTPDRSNWVYDASGNIKSKATVEFHINEPLLNEGGYSKLTAYGYDYQYAQIEQDITNVTNYSNGNNLINTVGEKLYSVGTGNSIFRPKAGEWLSSPAPSNIKIAQLISGSTTKSNASISTYTIYYGSDCRIEFSANAVPSGGWVEADYTARNNLYFKTHNSSTLVAIDNGSSPNFDVTYEVDEFVPKFVTVDNRQTVPFTPSANGISEQYNGLEYSVLTDRAIGMAVTSSVAPISGSSALSYIVNDYEPDEIHGDNTANAVPPSNGKVTLPSGNQWIKIDLGSVYMIGSVSVSHSYGLDRKYHNTKTEVSEDGINWTAIYDSAVSGEYSEKPTYHANHNHTHYAKFINFGALPTRYVRDWSNGWISGDGLTSGNTSDWTEVRAYGDWQVEKGYVYPSNSPKAGQQIATNGIGFISTDIPKAYVAMNIQIEFTSWWYMTYIIGPQFGKIKVEMPTLMNSGHYLTQEAPFVNNIAHRHIMSFPPSNNVKADTMNNIEAGKHRVILRQESGKVTIDRLRFEDFQYYNRSSLLIPTSTSATLFTRYKVIAEQAKWYQGIGIQSTEGAYDTPRTNPDTGVPDKSVPIKYRVRLRTELNADGTKEERGTAYATSSIFETGKLSTHWRRSESSDVFPASRLQQWNPSQPHNTGIQHDHLANGSIRGAKILANAIMDYHISNYARIQEHKLQLNYPTHDHVNKSILDSIQDWAGVSGNFGTGNTMARGDHKHDNLYLTLTGGTLTNTLIAKGINTSVESHFASGTYVDPATGTAYGLKVSQGIATDKLNVSGNVTITGNITITGTIDGVDVSSLNTNVTNHIGSGGSAHAVAISGGANGFIDGVNYGKLLRIQDNSINQTTTDGRYAQLNGGNLNGTTLGKMLEHERDSLILGNNDWTPLLYGIVGATPYYNSAYRGVTFSGGSNWARVRTRIPVDPESTYFVRTKVTKHSGSGSVYIGADSLDNNYASIATDQAQSYNYFGASNLTIASGNSQYFEATISGYNTTSGGATNKFDPEAKYFDLVLIGNYNGSGETTFEWLELYKAPNTFYVGSNGVLHSGNFNTSTLNGHVGSGGTSHPVAVSGGVNGFIDGPSYAKLLNIQANAINQATADTRYLTLSGGNLTGTLNAKDIYTTGNVNITGNIILTGTVDGVDVSALNSSYSVTSGNVTNHIGSGGSAHPIAISGGTAGFIDGPGYAKLLNIQANAINQVTTDSRYLQLTGGALSGGLSVTGNITLTGTVDGVDVLTLNTNVTNHIGSGNTAHPVAISGGVAGFIDGANYAKLLNIQANAINQTTADGRYLQLTGGALSGNLSVTGNIVLTGTVDGVDVAGLNSNYNTTSGNVTSHIGSGGSAHALVNPSTHGFMSFNDFNKLATVSTSANNYVHPSGDGNLHVPVTSTTNANKVLKAGATAGSMSWASVDWSELSSKPLTFTPPIATSSVLGGVKQGTNISIDVNGVISGAYGLATSSGNGLMSNSDFSKLLTVAQSANNYVHPVGSGSNHIPASGASGNLLKWSSDGVAVWANADWNELNNKPSNATQTVSGLFSYTDKTKLDSVSPSANNYAHPTGDGNYHIPPVGTGNIGKILKANPSSISADLGTPSYLNTASWEFVDWSEITNKPNPSAHTHSANQITDLYGSIYNKTEVDGLVSGSVKQGLANTLTNLNTFSNAGLSIKIQPSANITNSTKLLQINNASGNELFSVNYSGGVSIAGDFTVTGVQTFSGTTTVNGDYTVNGQLIVGGNSTLGDASTDVTTVNGTLKVQNGSIQEIGRYTQVHRRPLYGIAGDLQFQTDSTTFDSIVTNNYDPSSGYGLPTVQAGATRYYRLYTIYSDDINSSQVSGGQVATLRYSGNVAKDFNLPMTWGGPNDRRDWYSPYFNDLPTGHATLYTKLQNSGNNVGIRWIELIAYDKF